MAEKLNGEERTQALIELQEKGWVLVEGRDALQKSFKFKNFVNAFAWMTKAAFWAEKLNHHPEWQNVYNRVDVTLITHDCDGLTALDVKLAHKMEALV